MFCSKCGKENLSSNQYCGSCGQPLLINDPRPAPPILPPYQYQYPTPYLPYLNPVPAESAFALYLGCFKKYAQFQGRARRSEYWYFGLIHLLAVLVLALVGVVAMVSNSGRPGIGNLIAMVIAGIYFLVGIIPGLAVLSRRLHDTGRSGKWIILFVIGGIIPIVNLVITIVQIVFTAQDSQPGPNQYGQSPKYPGPPPQAAYSVVYPE